MFMNMRDNLILGAIIASGAPVMLAVFWVFDRWAPSVSGEIIDTGGLIMDPLSHLFAPVVAILWVMGLVLLIYRKALNDNGSGDDNDQ
jgi:hypothetical protein